LLRPAPGERWRHVKSRVFTALCALCALVVIAPLLSIVLHVARRGLPGLRIALFTRSGIGDAALGSLELIALACGIGVPVGVGAALYLSEVGRGNLARLVRVTANVLTGVPSITVGVCVFALVVEPMRRFSVIAGAVALAVMMIPRVTRTSEELLRRVPPHLREASLGLGVSSWRTSVFVVLRTALPGIGAGVMLAVARIAGEAAPLLLTSTDLSLPVSIFTDAPSGYQAQQDQAWTGALVLVAIVFVFSILGRRDVEEPAS
jgi:phosphate transport system permease protein